MEEFVPAVPVDQYVMMEDTELVTLVETEPEAVQEELAVVMAEQPAPPPPQYVAVQAVTPVL